MTLVVRNEKNNYFLVFCASRCLVRNFNKLLLVLLCLLLWKLAVQLPSSVVAYSGSEFYLRWDGLRSLPTYIRLLRPKEYQSKQKPKEGIWIVVLKDVTREQIPKRPGAWEWKPRALMLLRVPFLTIIISIQWAFIQTRMCFALGLRAESNQRNCKWQLWKKNGKKSCFIKHEVRNPIHQK